MVGSPSMALLSRLISIGVAALTPDGIYSLITLFTSDLGPNAFPEAPSLYL